jgi:hypothetical protein
MDTHYLPIRGWAELIVHRVPTQSSHGWRRGRDKRSLGTRAAIYR